jgi:RNA polymerase subunit RPABC4/transcription elongation factor Spt4
MQVRNQTPRALAAEVQIVPSWAWVLAVITFVAAQFFFNVFLARQPNAPRAWARPLIGLLAGLFGGFYFLLLGYVNRDAKRRGMSPILWTCVAVLIPNALGFLLYFVLRQPIGQACPQCGNAVQIEFNFCPRCNYKLSPSCPQCERMVGAGDVYCPYCGTSLRNHPASLSNPPTRLPG